MAVRLIALASIVGVAAFLIVLATMTGGGRHGQNPAVQRGRQIYVSTCIACHNGDPSLDGAVGPAVKGASKALLEARLAKAEYPPGYAPKRATHLMPAQPQLVASVDDLAAFLNAP